MARAGEDKPRSFAGLVIFPGKRPYLPKPVDGMLSTCGDISIGVIRNPVFVIGGDGDVNHRYCSRVSNFIARIIKRRKGLSFENDNSSVLAC